MRHRKSGAGFSLIELVVAVAILMTLAAIAIPNLAIIVANYKLDASGRSIVSLMESGRVLAVKTNQAQYVLFDATRPPGIAFVASDPSASYALGDFSIELAPGLSSPTSGLPDHQQLDAYLGSSVVVKVGTAVGFNARGLPCIAGNTAGTLCRQVDPVLSGTPGFLWFVKGPATNAWEAVSVTPAGRIKNWRLSQIDATTNSCGYPACWN